MAITIEYLAETLAAAGALEGLGANVAPNVVPHLGQLVCFLATYLALQDLPEAASDRMNYLRADEAAVLLAGPDSMLLEVIPVGRGEAIVFAARDCLGATLTGRVSLIVRAARLL